MRDNGLNMGEVAHFNGLGNGVEASRVPGGGIGIEVDEGDFSSRSS
jgi:hypothetical protein